MYGRRRFGREVRQCESVPQLLGILAGDVRFEIIGVLASKSCNVTSLAEKLELSLPHVSHNLGILLLHGLVDVVQIKRERFYRLSDLVRVNPDNGRLNMRILLRNGGDLLIQMLGREVA
jgi:DNA-binding transcriptional ArsR family regulator